MPIFCLILWFLAPRPDGFRAGDSANKLFTAVISAEQADMQQQISGTGRYAAAESQAQAYIAGVGFTLSKTKLNKKIFLAK